MVSRKEREVGVRGGAREESKENKSHFALFTQVLFESFAVGI